MTFSERTKMAEKSFTRTKMLEEINYVPYCGADKCTGHWPRMKRTNKGCVCGSCGFSFEFDQDFIDRYNEKWNAEYPFMSKLEDESSKCETCELEECNGGCDK